MNRLFDRQDQSPLFNIENKPSTFFNKFRDQMQASVKNDMIAPSRQETRESKNYIWIIYFSSLLWIIIDKSSIKIFIF